MEEWCSSLHRLFEEFFQPLARRSTDINMVVSPEQAGLQLAI